MFVFFQNLSLIKVKNSIDSSFHILCYLILNRRVFHMNIITFENKISCVDLLNKISCLCNVKKKHLSRWWKSNTLFIYE
jgi:hypothetical protein